MGRDERLYERFGLQDGLPVTVFPAGSRSTSALCPECGSQTHRRICPLCHSQLPPYFGQIRSDLIAMIGAKESGKTVFLTVLLHELGNSVARRFRLSVQGSDDHTRDQLRLHGSGLYGDGRLPFTTVSAAARYTRPLVFNVQQPGNGLVGGRRETIMSFFDTAGEDLSLQESVELNTRYLAAAGGVILLLDPLRMPGARRFTSGQDVAAGVRGGFDTPLNILSRVTDLLRVTSGRGPAKKIRVPIAVAFSKLDALWDSFDPGSPLAREPHDGRPVLDLDDCTAVHDHVRALLYEWGEEQIDQLLDANYEQYSFFGLSALGGPPREGRVVGAVRPYRVEDPFLWLLAQFGVIPVRSSKRRKPWRT
uniref:hypothetical protein n=1 Tax=Herbidospora sakaeratensis TaxID=564415 RepID=UPI000A6661B5|nr:hypothetical protein [Herbidospora sakaeratensis]